jgi:hypothetical protein
LERAVVCSAAFDGIVAAYQKNDDDNDDNDDEDDNDDNDDNGDDDDGGDAN